MLYQELLRVDDPVFVLEGGFQGSHLVRQLVYPGQIFSPGVLEHPGRVHDGHESVDKFDERDSEYFSAFQIGLNPEIRFTMFAPDYDGETVIEYGGFRFSVYRIYRATSDRMELYAQREAGTAGTVTTTTETTTTTTTPTEPSDEQNNG